MSFASSEEDRTAENERDRQIRDLEATMVAMRDALELAQREAGDQLQAAGAQASAEADQLKAMITTLRQERRREVQVGHQATATSTDEIDGR